MELKGLWNIRYDFNAMQETNDNLANFNVDSEQTNFETPDNLRQTTKQYLKWNSKTLQVTQIRGDKI